VSEGRKKVGPADHEDAANLAIRTGPSRSWTRRRVRPSLLKREGRVRIHRLRYTKAAADSRLFRQFLVDGGIGGVRRLS
jgi:hypothetical protein